MLKIKNLIKSFKFKIVMQSLLVILFSSISISTLVYLKTTANNKANLITEVQDKVGIINERLNSLTENTIRISNFLLESNILKENYTEEEETELRKKLEMYQKECPEIVNIIFSRHDKTFIYPYNESLEEGVPSTQTWYKSRANEENNANWTSAYEDAATGDLVVTYYQKVFSGDKHIGFIEIDLSLAHIKELVKSVDMSHGVSIISTDYNGVINMSTRGELGNKDIPDEELYNFVKENKDGTLAYNNGDKNKFAILTTLDSVVEWKIIGIMPQSELHKESSVFLKTIIFYTSIIAILSIIASIFFSEQIVKNIRKLNNNLNKLGQGDLTTQCDINSNDEISEMATAFNQSITNIRNLFKSTQETYNDLINGFEDMSLKSKENTQTINVIVESIQEISNDAAEQVMETSKMAANFDQLSGAMKNIDDSINEVNRMVNETQETNKSGVKVANNLLDATNVTNESTDKVRNAILGINETSSEIDSIVETITNIAEQTNLLALNASIEAARAGEYGKGFAVVADEVRLLAENSSTSANNVRNLIDRVKNQTKLAVEEIEIAKENTKIQTDAVTETLNSFDTLYISVNNLNDRINNIGNLNNEMIKLKNNMTGLIDNFTQKADNNSDATQSISAMTEQQLATMLEIEDYLQRLSTVSQELKLEISKFKTE